MKDNDCARVRSRSLVGLDGKIDLLESSLQLSAASSTPPVESSLATFGKTKLTPTPGNRDAGDQPLTFLLCGEKLLHLSANLHPLGNTGDGNKWGGTSEIFEGSSFRFCIENPDSQNTLFLLLLLCHKLDQNGPDPDEAHPPLVRVPKPLPQSDGEPVHHQHPRASSLKIIINKMYHH